MKRIKIIVFILLITISIVLFGNYSFAYEAVVTLDVSEGKIKITPTGYSVEGGEEIKFDGKYIITGTRTDVDIIEINNETDNKFNIDITLKDCNLLSSTWGTIFVITGDSPININLNVEGNCKIRSLGWAPIYSKNTAKVKMVIDDTNGSLNLENATWDENEKYNLIKGTQIYVENQNGDIIDVRGHIISKESGKIKSEATCEENEVLIYKCQNCGEEIEVEIEGTAIGHNYEAKYNWSEDEKTCNLDLICKNDNTHIISNIEMEISKEVLSEPTCIEKGITKYTATTTRDGVVYQNSIEKTDIEATEEHNYIDGVCSVCGKQDPISNKETPTGEKDDTPKTGTTDIIGYVLLVTIISALGIVVLNKKETK